MESPLDLYALPPDPLRPFLVKLARLYTRWVCTLEMAAVMHTFSVCYDCRAGIPTGRIISGIAVVNGMVSLGRPRAHV